MLPSAPPQITSAPSSLEELEEAIMGLLEMGLIEAVLREDGEYGFALTEAGKVATE